MFGKCLSLVVTLVIVFGLLACADREERVFIPDPTLRRTFRELLGPYRNYFYLSELERLTSFAAPKRNIADLTGLEYCINLRQLYLSYNRITDISPLTSLTILTTLNLKGNPLDDDSLNIYIPQFKEVGVNVSW